MSKLDGNLILDRLITCAPYLILVMAIWRMASIHDDNEINLAAGLQALFLALAAIFLKIDIRDRSTDRIVKTLEKRDDD